MCFTTLWEKKQYNKFKIWLNYRKTSYRTTEISIGKGRRKWKKTRTTREEKKIRGINEVRVKTRWQETDKLTNLLSIIPCMTLIWAVSCWYEKSEVGCCMIDIAWDLPPKPLAFTFEVPMASSLSLQREKRAICSTSQFRFACVNLPLCSFLLI